MSIERDKSFEVNNGVVINDGPGYFHDDSAPQVSVNDIDGDRYVDSFGRRWTYRSSEWFLENSVSFSIVYVDEVYLIREQDEMLVTRPIINSGLIINRGLIRSPNLVQPEIPEPFVQEDRFDYHKVNVLQEVIIPENQIMHPGRHLINRGRIINRGRTLFTPTVEFLIEDSFLPLETIELNEVVIIKSRRQLLLKSILNNNGLIKNYGRIVLL